MSMILHSLFPLSMTKISALSVLFPYLFRLQSPKVFYFCNFPALALVDVKTICLHILSQISSTGASVLFFQVCRVSLSCLSYIGFQLGQNTNRQYGWHFQFSLCRACIAGHVVVVNAIFYCICSECLFLGRTYKTFSFPFQLTCFQPLPPPLISHPLFLSVIDHSMFFLSMLPAFHSLVLLYSSH